LDFHIFKLQGPEPRIRYQEGALKDQGQGILERPTGVNALLQQPKHHQKLDEEAKKNIKRRQIASTIKYSESSPKMSDSGPTKPLYKGKLRHLL
jgi:hypothetical protein